MQVFHIECAGCGNPLVVHLRDKPGTPDVVLSVQVCPVCIRDAEAETLQQQR
jgi:hypothetical protein